MEDLSLYLTFVYTNLKIIALKFKLIILNSKIINDKMLKKGKGLMWK
jgi:hypothetical protein